MSLPFVTCTIQYSNAANCDFSDISREGGPGANGAKEGVPAVGNGRGMQEGAVEGDKTARAAAGKDVLDDSGLSGVGGSWVLGRVGETHSREPRVRDADDRSGWKGLQKMPKCLRHYANVILACRECYRADTEYC